MPKTLPIARGGLSVPPAPRATRLAPLALFALAYLAVLAVLFAPDGYFLSALDSDPAPAAALPAQD